jgi:ribosomal protein S18 acetylase RimI-like enzyme
MVSAAQVTKEWSPTTNRAIRSEQWYRYFSEVEPGFGFIAAHIPEVAVAVAPGSRGRGVGTALLQALADRARREGLSALSLSVEEGNQAVRLYERIGFNPVGRDTTL